MRDRSWTRWKVVLVALLGVATLIGCGPSSEQAPAANAPSSRLVNPDKALVGTAWQLDGSKATLKITGVQLLASNGCQYLQGAVTIRPGVIMIKSPAVSAGPFCQTVDRLGLAVFPVLIVGNLRWHVRGDHLKLTDRDGRALHYSSG